MAKSKKNSKKKRQNNRPPQQNQAAQQSAAANTPDITDRPKPVRQKPQSDKPLFMRIIMLTIAVVMMLGIVISAVAGAAGNFF